MSELISGKEALIALANGQEVEFQEPVKDKWIWMSAKHLTIENILNHTATHTVQNSPSCVEHNSYSIQFRLKPQTIKLTIEVPKPFEPKDGDKYWHLAITKNGYIDRIFGDIGHDDSLCMASGAWRTEDEIKQVVAELRKLKGEGK